MNASNDPTRGPTTQNRKRTPWLLTAVLGLAGLALVVSAIAVSPAAAGLGRHGGFFGHGDGDHVRFGVEWMLRDVDASDEQLERIVAIAEQAHDELTAGRADHRARFAALADLLSAEEIDAAALERLRAEQVVRLEQASTRLTRTLVEVAEVLTPEQRSQLIETHREHAGRHGRHGFWK